TRVAIVGRNPAVALRNRAARDANLIVTGTVPDVRPYLWGAAVSIVPLRVGSGTRLKIFEAMAARIPVVSTTVGAEGLPARDGETILLADNADAFARACVTLLEDDSRRQSVANAGLQMVASTYSWDAAAQNFESL